MTMCGKWNIAQFGMDFR